MLLANSIFNLDPLLALGLVVTGTGAAVLGDACQRRQRKKALRSLSIRLKMTYTAYDRLRVKEKIAESFPVPGAADLYVHDILYVSLGEIHRYVFTVEYTVGAVRPKRRLVRVASLCEARDRCHPCQTHPAKLASCDLPWIKQYEALATSDGTIQK